MTPLVEKGPILNPLRVTVKTDVAGIAAVEVVMTIEVDVGVAALPVAVPLMKTRAAHNCFGTRACQRYFIVSAGGVGVAVGQTRLRPRDAAMRQEQKLQALFEVGRVLARALDDRHGAACVPLVGVGFPGHFMVGHPPTGRYLDVFRRGLPLDRKNLLELLRRQGIGPDGWRDEFLAPVTKGQMLMRMLNNLRRHYTQTGESTALHTVIAMTHGLEAVRERGSTLLLVQ